MIRATTQQKPIVWRKGQCTNKEKIFPELGNFFSAVIPQPDCIIVFPLLALYGAPTASCNRSAIVRKRDAEDCDFVTAKESIALARR